MTDATNGLGRLPKPTGWQPVLPGLIADHTRYNPDALLPIHFAAVADDTDDDLLCFLVGKIKHSVIADADTPAVAILKLLAAGRKRIVLQPQQSPGNAGLKLSGKTG
jgi:hypothetical protein